MFESFIIRQKILSFWTTSKPENLENTKILCGYFSSAIGNLYVWGLFNMMAISDIVCSGPCTEPFMSNIRELRYELFKLMCIFFGQHCKEEGSILNRLLQMVLIILRQKLIMNFCIYLKHILKSLFHPNIFKVPIVWFVMWCCNLQEYPNNLLNLQQLNGLQFWFLILTVKITYIDCNEENLAMQN